MYSLGWSEEETMELDFQISERIHFSLIGGMGGWGKSCYLSLKSINCHILTESFLFRSADLVGLQCQLEGDS